MLHQNETWFVDPFNRILTPFPTVLPCSDLMPVRWLLNEQWFCAHPQVLPCSAPLRLNTTTTAYVPVHDFTLGMGQGVYSPEQRKQHERYVVAQMSRRPVVSKITNAATMGGGHGQLGIPLSLPELDGLSYHFVWKFFPVIYFLGGPQALLLPGHGHSRRRCSPDVPHLPEEGRERPGPETHALPLHVGLPLPEALP